ncbi:hypothetical protein [Roseibium sp.]|uniref:hypothetical protein n=1 Tax=Roseibium sp. TaxID=1936156 RepID=UPI003A97D325
MLSLLERRTSVLSESSQTLTQRRSTLLRKVRYRACARDLHLELQAITSELLRRTLVEEQRRTGPILPLGDAGVAGGQVPLFTPYKD